MLWPGLGQADPDSQLPSGFAAVTSGAGQHGAERWNYELSQFIPLLFFVLLGVVFYALGAPTRRARGQRSPSTAGRGRAVMIKRIVLALDGSPESDYALPITQELALATGAAVTVVHVREMMLAPVVGGVPRRVDDERGGGARAADVAALIDAGVDAELQIVASTYAGGPAHEIAEVAKEVEQG